jgi:hypothetical protein
MTKRLLPTTLEESKGIQRRCCFGVREQNSSRIHRRLLGCFVQGSAKEENEIVGLSPSSEKAHNRGWI